MNEALGAKTLKVIKCASRLHRRVTASDIAMSTGLSVADAERELTRLTSKVNGHLEVSKNGEIVYAFPRGFRQALMLSPIEARLRKISAVTVKAVWWTVKMYFGTTLIISICLEFVIIFAVLVRFLDGGDFGNFGGNFGGSGSGKKKKGSKTGSKSGNVTAQPKSLYDPEHFETLSFAKYRDAYSRKLAKLGQLEGETSKPLHQTETADSNVKDTFSAFCAEMFSYLFGDDNPNKLIEDERNAKIAQLILARRGVVIAEELAPFLDVDAANLGDEKFVVPVLARYNGRAKVSDSGQLIYVFEPANVSAVSGQHDVPVPNFLEERHWTLTYPWHVQALVIVNVVLAVLAVPFSVALGPIWMPLAVILMFNAFIYILLNWIAKGKVAWQNQLVDSRNQRRQGCIEHLLDSANDIESKLQVAATFRTDKSFISEADIVYRTDADVIEQSFEMKPGIENAAVVSSKTTVTLSGDCDLLEEEFHQIELQKIELQKIELKKEKAPRQ